MELKELHRKAGESTTRFVLRVQEGRWDKLSNCAPWTVRDLLSHMVSENLWAPELLAGKTVQEVGDRFEGDVLGKNPQKAWETSFAASQQALDKLPSLEQTVHLSYGDVPASHYLQERLTDLLVHGWDVASSTGQEETLDPELCGALYDIVLDRKAQIDELRGEIFGEEVKVPASADVQTKLLAFLGRKRP